MHTIKSKGIIIYIELRTVVIWGWGEAMQSNGSTQEAPGVLVRVHFLAFMEV